MNTQQGFTLVEVLISLLIMTSTCLGLLIKQWDASKSEIETTLYFNALIALDNHTERVLSKLPSVPILFPFTFRQHRVAKQRHFTLTWSAKGVSRHLGWPIVEERLCFNVE